MDVVHTISLRRELAAIPPLMAASLPLLPTATASFAALLPSQQRRGGLLPIRGPVVRATRRGGDNGTNEEEAEEPVLLRKGVSVVTEALRLFSNPRGRSSLEVEPPPRGALVEAHRDVLQALRQDYARAYFLTGDFTGALYADDCLFADPTIQFRGREKYGRNLKLLVPFLEDPKLTLFDIQEEDLKSGQERSINAKWNLRTYIRLPWKPLIDVDGSTLYVMDANSKIVKHIERWSISGGEAVQQLFVPSDRAFFRKQSN